ncbi:MAG TPA: hypothetical protein VGD89_08540, partial [Flavipsychrobacter sp.]
NKEIANNYNDSLHKYFRIEDAIDIEIKIENIGTMRATEIYVELTFPGELLVIEVADKKNNSKPQWPKEIPKHPINVAMGKLAKANTLGSLLSQPTFGGMLGTNRLEAILPRLKPSNLSYWTNLKNNKITIKINSLVQTRSMRFDEEYMITPLKEGDYNIEVSVISTELPQKIISTIPISVKAQD